MMGTVDAPGDIKSICVFCGSSDEVQPEYLAEAYRLGAYIAEQNICLVYGAGSTGLMGAVANGALDVGGEVIGVIPDLFNTTVLAHHNLSRMEVVSTMHQRQSRMVELSDAFIALPGGFGTLSELFEVLTWAQIGLHRKPIGVLNYKNYYDPLIGMIQRAREEGFIYTDHLALFSSASHPEILLETLRNHRYPERLSRWLTRQES
jgi:uncharacterized protein (TIGR00730 family)